MKPLDLVGETFGRLTVIREIVPEARIPGKREQRKWLCLCECGVEREVWQTGLRSGRSRSCGCLHREISSQQATKNFKSHGNRNHPAYPSWAAMKTRCGNPRSSRYPLYGGRGIAYDQKWETFEGFWEDMGDAWKEGLSLDRIDTNGNYCKENCRWATQKEQTRNKRNNRLLEYKGETRCLAEWCDTLGLPYNTILCRLIRGKCSVEKAFETPLKG